MPVSDLTGTKWRFNANITDTGIHGLSLSLNGTIEASDYSLNYTYLASESTYQHYIYFRIVDSIRFPSFQYYTTNGWQYREAENTRINIDPPVVEITGGSSVTNAALIAWFEANATQVISGNTYTFTNTLTNITHGNVSFIVEPDSGYQLPSSSSSIIVTNGTLVSYDNTTREIVVSGDNAEISISCEEVSSGHNLTINFVARNYASGVGENYLRIKLNEIPSSDADYDGYFATPWAGSTGYFDLDDVQVVDVGYTTGGTYTINNVSSFTYWHEYENISYGDFIGVNSSSMPAPDWTNKVSVPLTQDTTMTVYYDYDV